MRIRISTQDITDQKVDLAVCFAYEDDTEPRGIGDDGLKAEVAAQMKADRFTGQPGDPLVWNPNGGRAFRRLLVVGLGKPKDAPGESVRQGAARAARAAAKFSARTLALTLPGVADDRAALEARAAIEGAIFGAYQFDRHLTDPGRKTEKLTGVVLAAPGASAAVKRAVREAEIAGRAVALARDLVNEAPSRMTPKILAQAAVKEARARKLKSKVLGPAELKKLGMHALLAVARGSEEPPQVVHLTYKPSTRARSKIVLVGKGVTFDSGGLNLKPGDYMLTMKSDMGGAAAVLGAMSALAELSCPHEVHGLLGLTENMTGGDAYKPGDILSTYKGKTVEIGNTDAEGRLVMCDLLAHAEKTLKPDIVVDVATLTGACVVALGTQATGLFTRHDDLRDTLLEGAAAAGEKLWPLPMYDEYLALLQRGPADLNNIGGRWGGATTAALFLGEFLSRDLPWAHLDIAGPAFLESETPEAPLGATGAGVATLLRWLAPPS